VANFYWTTNIIKRHSPQTDTMQHLIEETKKIDYETTTYVDVLRIIHNVRAGKLDVDRLCEFLQTQNSELLGIAKQGNMDPAAERDITRALTVLNKLYVWLDYYFAPKSKDRYVPRVEMMDPRGDDMQIPLRDTQWQIMQAERRYREERDDPETSSQRRKELEYDWICAKSARDHLQMFGINVLEECKIDKVNKITR
jgi:hypothetical protein